jgi:hypothetical protein
MERQKVRLGKADATSIDRRGFFLFFYFILFYFIFYIIFFLFFSFSESYSVTA